MLGQGQLETLEIKYLTVSGQLEATGSARLASLAVDGQAAFGGDASVSGTLQAASLSTAGAADLGSLKVQGPSTLKGTLSVAGALAAAGDLSGMQRLP